MSHKDPEELKRYKKKYNEEVRAGIRVPTPKSDGPRLADVCPHTEQIHFALGLCRSCYAKANPRSNNSVKAYACEHTDEANFALGLCVRCYRKFDYQTNPEKYKANAKKNRLNRPKKKHDRFYQIKQKHGLAVQALYRQLHLDQANQCCCGQNFDDTWVGAPRLDHDHSCCPYNKRVCGLCVRGLLCNDCNRVLGIWKDRIQLLPPHLSEYLARYEAKRNAADLLGFRDTLNSSTGSARS